jgi:hypothetical protein
MNRRDRSTRLDLGGPAVAVGGLLAVVGAAQPWASAGLDYGRDAVTVLVLGITATLIGLVMIVRPSSRAIAAVGLVLGIVISAFVLRDGLDVIERRGSIQIGLYLAGLGGVLTTAGAAWAIVGRRPGSATR